MARLVMDEAVVGVVEVDGTAERRRESAMLLPLVSPVVSV